MKKNYPVTGKEVMMGAGESIISMTDLKGTITYVNQCFIDISGFREDELIGKSHNIVRHPDMPPEAFEDLWKTVKGGEPWRGIVKNRCANGDHYWVEAFVTPIYDGDQAIGYQSVRSAPSREQVAAAEKLYKRLNSKELKSLPKKHGVSNISIQMRIVIAYAMIALFSLAGSFGMFFGFSDTLAAGLGIASVVILLVSALLIKKTLLEPLGQVSRIARGIASGNLQQSIEVNSSDELGRMMLNMKLMQARLQAVIERIAHSADQVASEANRLSESAEMTRTILNRQHTETDLVATAMNEMSATVQEVAKNTEEAATSAHEAELEAENGRNVVNKVHHAINSLASEVEKSSDVIQ
jgi:aerotaxis receptor